MPILRAKEDDIDSILELCQRCKSNLIKNNIDQWDEKYPTREDFEEDVKDGTLFIEKCEDSGKILGCIVMNEHQDLEYNEVNWIMKQGRPIVIHRLMTDPLEEGKGIAQKLLKFAENEAIKEHYDSVRLDVFSMNLRAVNFYKRNGYQYVGEVKFRKGKFYCGEKKLI